MNRREEDFQKLESLILSLEKKSDVGTLTLDLLKKYQHQYEILKSRYPSIASNPRIGDGSFKLLEYRALISLAQGDEATSSELLERARDLMGPNESWISETAQKWDDDLIDPEFKINQLEKKFSGNIEGLLAVYALNIFVVPIFLLYDLLVSGPELKKLIADNPLISSDFQGYYNFAVVFDIVALILLVVLGYHFFTKRKKTKILAIIFGFTVLIGQFIIYTMLTDISTKYGTSSDSSSGSLITISSILWPFYWMFSKRAKETFTRE